MDFETGFSLDSTGAPTWAPEAIREQSEKQKESYKKAQAQLQKTQRDESKAQKDNSVLFAILLRFIQNPYYSDLVPSVTELLSINIPSRYILSLTALVYPESALHILTAIGKKDSIQTLLSIHRHEEHVDFDEATIDPTIREWVSLWVSSIHAFILHEESSVVATSLLRKRLQETHDTMIRIFSEFLLFFFQSRNVDMSKKMAKSYAEFLSKELNDMLDTALKTSDVDLANLVDGSTGDFFWLDASTRG